MTIAEQNDFLRAQLPCLPTPHRLFLTDEVATLSTAKLAEVFSRLRAFDGFDASNDPYNEHDFVSIPFEDESIFLKVDYFDKELKCYRENGIRVMTIMFSHEY